MFLRQFKWRVGVTLLSVLMVLGGLILPAVEGNGVQAQGQLPAVRYDVGRNTIYIGANYSSGDRFAGFPSHPDAIAAKARISILQLDRALATQFPNAPDALVDQGGGVWLLKANTVISATARLDVTKETISELRLDSSPNRPAPALTTITAHGGYLNIDGVKVLSWADIGPDTNIADGRSYLLAYRGGRMDIRNADISHLGWASGEPSGLSWRERGTKSDTKSGATGEITDSVIHNNYKGQYSFEAYGMKVLRNQFHSNISYGFDPHDFSEAFEVAFNMVYNNGNHGIIFSRGCINNHIHNNTVYGNTGHGIMLDRGSDNNLVERNVVYNNRDGVAIFQSVNNIVRFNELRENGRGVRVNATFMPGDEYDGIAANNTITNNKIEHNSEYGVYLYQRADKNIIEANTIIGNLKSGVYIKTGGNSIKGNTINTNGAGVTILGTEVYTTGTVAAVGAPGRDNIVQGNSIESNDGVGVQLRGAQGTLIGVRASAPNAADANTISNNGSHGVSFDAASANNTVAGNVIHANGLAGVGDGVVNRGTGATGNRISRNSITVNTRSGVRNADGASAGIQPPTITSAANATTVTGTAAANATVEIYRDPNAQGSVFLGTTIADASGAWSFTLPQNDNPNSGAITALAIDANGNTSAFSGRAAGGANVSVGVGRNGDVTVFVNGQGSTVTLPEIARTLATISPTVTLLEDQGGGVWQANASLFIGRGVTLNLTRETVSWLKLRSQGSDIRLTAANDAQYNYRSFTTLRAFNGAIVIDGVKVTSWDPQANTFDTDVSNGRSYILAKYEARLDVRNADLSYLGSADGESYGVSWRDTNSVDENGNSGPLRTRVTGEAINSIFSNNYYGVYTYQAINMTFRGNRFHNNISYGFDPHDFTNNVLVENNEAFSNGNHGFIISRGCTTFVFRRNKSYNNTNPDPEKLAHGFMLDPGSPNSEYPQVPSSDNLLEQNEAYDNEGYGLRILGSTNNTIRNNTFRNNQQGITVEQGSAGNIITGNTIERNMRDGIEIKAGINTLLEGNTIRGNGAHGVYLTSGAGGARLMKNTIAANRGNGIRANGQDVAKNMWSENSVFDNATGGIVLTGRANGGIRPPMIERIEGKQVSGKAAPGAVVELFSDTGYQARTFEGRVTAQADSRFTLTIAGAGSNISATATDANGNSSALPGNAGSVYLPLVRR
jgi:parallel beta-helix repeat protein